MKKVMIVGHGDTGLAGKALAEIQEKGYAVEIVNTIEDIHIQDASKIITQMIPKMPLFAPDTRREKRAKARKLKKRK
jgi:hypothetical protein